MAKKIPSVSFIHTNYETETDRLQRIGRITREPHIQAQNPLVMSTREFAETVFNKLDVQEKKISEIEKLNIRISELEKKVFGEYMHRRITNKTDGSGQFEEDVAMFFQLDMHLNSWKKIFQDLKIPIDHEDVVKLSNSYKLPVKK